MTFRVNDRDRITLMAAGDGKKVSRVPLELADIHPAEVRLGGVLKDNLVVFIEN